MRFLDIQKQIQQFSIELKEMDQLVPNKDRIRHALTAIGTFATTIRWQSGEIQQFFAEQPLVGVDGSINTYGSRNPNAISLLQSMAKSTRKIDGVGEVIYSDIISPLRKADQEKILEWQKQNGNRNHGEDAANEYLKGRLAELEVEAAITALNIFNPKVILMDGGFLRYEKWASSTFKALRKHALKKGIFLLGVIEEIGSGDVAKTLEKHGAISLQGFRDRELFYGLIGRGEYFSLHADYQFKPVRDQQGEKYGTIFTRLADHPQAIAIDYLMEQQEEVPQLMGLLYALTPASSRGIPQWLDIVDAEVRIKHKDLQVLLESVFDPGILERFFRPMREKRDF